VPTAVVGLRPAGRPARLTGTDQRRQFGDRIVDHGVGSLPQFGLSVAS